MTVVAKATSGALVIPEWGYDHLVLADWRTSVLRFQPRDEDGHQLSIFKTGYRTAAGVDLTVRLERGAATDFPTAQDDDVLLGLLYLAHDQGFPDIVRFLPDQLTRIIRWPRNDRSYKRITTALDRYKKLSATFRHNWYSKKDRAIKLQLMTGIVAQAEVVTHRGRRAANAQPESHVQWTENFAASLREGNVLPINLRLLYGWSRPGAKQLHRQLNKTWRGGRKPTIYERDLRELACGHLGMTDSKSLKRNFHQVVVEMEQKGYLTPMSFNDRYMKIGTGIWRTRFDLHSDHVLRAPTSARAVDKAKKVGEQSHAQGIVQEYHRARFGRMSYTPKLRELEHARELIAAFGFEAVSAVTRAVAQAVRAQNQNDLYFGFAVPYFRTALESAAASHGFRQQLSAHSTAAHADQERIQEQSLERHRQRSRLLSAWRDATARERDRYREMALQRAESETVRRRIRQSSAETPVHEVLQEIELASGGGELCTIVLSLLPLLMSTVASPIATQPHSLDAEKTVLGALLLDPEAITKIAATLRPVDFYDPIYRRVYEVCLQVYESRSPVDLVTVSEELASDEAVTRLGGTAFLVTLAQDVPTASHVTHYAEIVRDKARRRSLIRAGQRIAGLGYAAEEFPAMLEQSQSELLAVADNATETKPESIEAVTERRYEQIAQVQATGDAAVLRRVSSGFQSIDYYFNGFAPGSLTVIAARPSMGKTALATDIALHAAHAKKRVLIFSLEMTKEEVSDRITASSLGVPTWKIEKGDITDEQVRQIGVVVDGFADCPLYIDDDPDTSLSNLRAKAIRHQLEHGLDLLIVDYLQLIEVPKGMAARENRVQEISIISRGLKQLARELSVPVIALSQLNRAVENAPQCIPQLSHLRESGSIEQDAHNVLMLWREGYYNEDCESPDLTTIFIRKNRQGPVGTAELMFNKELMRFHALQR